jgi:hypothetical protein
MAQGAYPLSPCSHLLSRSNTDRAGGSVPPLWFPRWSPAPVVMSLALGGRCRSKVAWEACEAKITSLRLESRSIQAPYRIAASLSDARLGQRDHQGLWILINSEPESTRGLKAWASLHSTVQGPAASHVVCSGERTRYL